MTNVIATVTSIFFQISDNKKSATHDLESWSYGRLNLLPILLQKKNKWSQNETKSVKQLN